MTKRSRVRIPGGEFRAGEGGRQPSASRITQARRHAGTQARSPQHSSTAFCARRSLHAACGRDARQRGASATVHGELLLIVFIAAAPCSR